MNGDERTTCRELMVKLIEVEWAGIRGVREGVLEAQKKRPAPVRVAGLFILFLPYFKSRALRRHDFHECPYQSLVSSGTFRAGFLK